MKRVLITEKLDPLLAEGLEAIGFECEVKPGISQEEVKEIIHGYEGIIIATRIRLAKEILEHASRLKFIARAGSGMETIDVEYAKSKNIQCINSPEGNANSVGEHAVALLLAMFHIFSECDFTFLLLFQSE